MPSIHRLWPAALLALATPLLHAQTTPASAPAATAAVEPASKARTDDDERPSRGEAQALQWFKLLDRNGDGVLTWDEVKGIPYKRIQDDFKAADVNGNGRVTQDEIRALSARRLAERRAREAAAARPEK